MNNAFLRSRLFWIIWLNVIAAHAGAQQFSLLHQLDVRWDQDGDHFTPIVTDDHSNLYFAFINAANKIVIGKKSLNGTTETTEVTPLSTEPDQYHSVPSIGLDRNGFIHVFGPMHHTDMDYLKSNMPFDVSSGFTRRDAQADGLLLGQFTSGRHHITYPYVFYDDDLNPWLAYRARVGSSGWNPGTMCAQLAKFNSTTNLWQAKGGNSNPDFSPIPGNPNPKQGCFAWSAYTESGVGGYQAWNAKPIVDSRDRLHYAVRHVRDTGSTSWGQDLFYAYSDDEGTTWHLADGTLVDSSPIAISNIENQPAVLWADGPTGGNHIYGSFSAASKGRPVVGYNRRAAAGQAGTTWFAIYEDGAWRHTDTGINAFPGRLLIDTHDVWYLVAGGTVWVSRDNGNNWSRNSSAYSGSKENSNVDLRYFRKTNKIRFVVAQGGNNGSKTVSILEYVDTDWAPPDIAASNTPYPPRAVVADK